MPLTTTLALLAELESTLRRLTFYVAHRVETGEINPALASLRAYRAELEGSAS